MLKNLHKRILVPVILFTGLASMLSSCSIERRLAGDYLNKKETTAVLLIAPDLVFKEGFKVPDSLNLDSLPEENRNTLLLQYTELVQYIDDSIFIDGYVNGLSYGLRQLGYKVFKDYNSHTFLATGDNRMILNLAQLQLEEYYIPVKDQASFSDDESYRYEFFITGININSWFELSGLNHSDSAIRVVFNSEAISDYSESDFRYFPLSGEVKYLYAVDSLRITDVYEAGRNTGYINAGNFHNYLINRYIRMNMPGGQTPEKIMVYDRVSGVLRKSDSTGFTEIQ